MHQQDSRRWSLRHRCQNTNTLYIRYTSTPTWSQAPNGMEVPQPTSPPAVHVNRPNRKSPSKAHVADRTVSSVRSHFPTLVSLIVNQPVTVTNVHSMLLRNDAAGDLTRLQFSDQVSITQPAMQFSDWWHCSETRGGNRAAALRACKSIARPRARLSAAARVSRSLLVLVRSHWGMSKPNEGHTTSSTVCYSGGFEIHKRVLVRCTYPLNSLCAISVSVSFANAL